MKRIIGALGISAALLCTFSCKEQLFTEYDDQSFLSTTSLSSDNWQLMPDYSFESGTTANDYMDYSLISSTGGPEGGPVYRLEIKNLLENGDFEDTTASPDWDPWFVYDEINNIENPVIVAPTEISVIDTGVNEVIDNRTVKFVMANDFRLTFRIPSNFINPSTYVGGKSYLFSMDYRTSSNELNIFFEPNWDATNGGSLDSYSFTAFGGQDGVEEDPNSIYLNTYPPLDPSTTSPEGPNIFTAINTGTSPVEDSLTFATSGSQSGYFDNFTVMRDSYGDFDLRLRLKLPTDHREDLPLIAGYYRFSVWVKQAALPEINMYHADRVELGITGYDTVNNSNFEEYRVYYKDSKLFDLYSQRDGAVHDGSWSSEWVQLVFETDDTVQLPDESNSYASVMELTIAPSNPGSTDSGWNRLSPGAIYISEPKLEYSSTPWN
ncbi:MAG: hypothetical protein PQJ58_07995 [Spirochaetales bacterium]|nr:hypothetical protein [Spirochaetales bacterium]